MRIQANGCVVIANQRVPEGDEGKKFGSETTGREYAESSSTDCPRKSKKAVCHELALKGERAENELASILVPKHEEGVDTHRRKDPSVAT